MHRGAPRSSSLLQGAAAAYGHDQGVNDGSTVSKQLVRGGRLRRIRPAGVSAAHSNAAGREKPTKGEGAEEGSLGARHRLSALNTAKHPHAPLGCSARLFLSLLPGQNDSLLVPPHALLGRGTGAGAGENQSRETCTVRAGQPFVCVAALPTAAKRLSCPHKPTQTITSHFKARAKASRHRPPGAATTTAP